MSAKLKFFDICSCTYTCKKQNIKYIRSYGTYFIIVASYISSRDWSRGWMGWLTTYHEWPCNYTHMQIKAMHYWKWYHAQYSYKTLIVHILPIMFSHKLFAYFSYQHLASYNLNPCIAKIPKLPSLSSFIVVCNHEWDKRKSFLTQCCQSFQVWLHSWS